jgi:hypothetical protein
VRGLCTYHKVCVCVVCVMACVFGWFRSIMRCICPTLSRLRCPAKNRVTCAGQKLKIHRRIFEIAFGENHLFEMGFLQTPCIVMSTLISASGPSGIDVEAHPFGVESGRCPCQSVLERSATLQLTHCKRA